MSAHLEAVNDSIFEDSSHSLTLKSGVSEIPDNAIIPLGSVFVRATNVLRWKVGDVLHLIGEGRSPTQAKKQRAKLADSLSISPSTADDWMRLAITYPQSERMIDAPHAAYKTYVNRPQEERPDLLKEAKDKGFSTRQILLTKAELFIRDKTMELTKALTTATSSGKFKLSPDGTNIIISDKATPEDLKILYSLSESYEKASKVDWFWVKADAAARMTKDQRKIFAEETGRNFKHINREAKCSEVFNKKRRKREISSSIYLELLSLNTEQQNFLIKKFSKQTSSVRDARELIKQLGIESTSDVPVTKLPPGPEPKDDTGNRHHEPVEEDDNYFEEDTSSVTPPATGAKDTKPKEHAPPPARESNIFKFKTLTPFDPTEPPPPVKELTDKQMSLRPFMGKPYEDLFVEEVECMTLTERMERRKDWERRGKPQHGATDTPSDKPFDQPVKQGLPALDEKDFEIYTGYKFVAFDYAKEYHEQLNILGLGLDTPPEYLTKQLVKTCSEIDPDHMPEWFFKMLKKAVLMDNHPDKNGDITGEEFDKIKKALNIIRPFDVKSQIK